MSVISQDGVYAALHDKQWKKKLFTYAKKRHHKIYF